MAGSVILSTYNGEKFISEQLDSLLNQDRKDFNILVRDDGSTDGTQLILKDYASRYKDRFVLILGNNIGTSRSFFHLIAQVKDQAEWCALCDQDDIWKPNKLTAALEKLNDWSETALPELYCSRTELVDQQLIPLGFSPNFGSLAFEQLIFENCATGCTVVLNKSALIFVGNNLPTKPVVHDWWIAAAIAIKGRIIFDPNPNILYRQHLSNQIGLSNSRFFEIIKHLKLLFKKRRDFYKPWHQASILLDFFVSEMTLNQEFFLRRFVSTRKSIACRIKYACSGPVPRRKKMDCLIARMLIAAGWY